MKQIAPEHKLILFIAPVRKGRNNRHSAGCDEGKAFPLLIVLIYLYIEKLNEELYFKSNAIQYAGDWDGFASSMSSFDTWSGVITSGAGSLVTNSLNLATIGDGAEKVTGFSSMNISDMRQLNGVIGSLATNGLEYAINGETTFNILNIADFGINALIDKKFGTPNGPKANASVGLLEINIGKKGLKTRLGSGGTNMSVTTVASALRGFDALKTNIAINHYTNKNDLQNAAIALRTQYGFGGKSEKDQLKNILNGSTIIKAGNGDGNAQTVTENGKRTVYLNGYSDNMTKEEQMKLGITLGHESYRDGVVSDTATQMIETRNAVAGHTDLMAGMLADDMYKSMMSGIIAGDTNLQMDLLARSLGDEVFNDYVDGMYDSSADYWRVQKDGKITWDGNLNLYVEKDIYDENGNLILNKKELLQEENGKGVIRKTESPNEAVNYRQLQDLIGSAVGDTVNISGIDVKVDRLKEIVGYNNLIVKSGTDLFGNYNSYAAEALLSDGYMSYNEALQSEKVMLTRYITGYCNSSFGPNLIEHWSTRYVLNQNDEFAKQDLANSVFVPKENQTVEKFRENINDGEITLPQNVNLLGDGESVYHGDGCLKYLFNKNDFMGSSRELVLRFNSENGKYSVENRDAYLGTYNFGNGPLKKFHTDLDVLPYWSWGNTPDDLYGSKAQGIQATPFLKRVHPNIQNAIDTHNKLLLENKEYASYWYLRNSMNYMY